jgi:hypothetical protein
MMQTLAMKTIALQPANAQRVWARVILAGAPLVLAAEAVGSECGAPRISIAGCAEGGTVCFPSPTVVDILSAAIARSS